jgi:hypothetical protein
MTLLMQVPAPVVQLEITEALSSAISAAAGLCAEDQNYLAWRIMEEIAEEQKWTDSFAGSLDVLDKLAAEALAEHDRGETRPLEEIL